MFGIVVLNMLSFILTCVVQMLGLIPVTVRRVVVVRIVRMMVAVLMSHRSSWFYRIWIVRVILICAVDAT